MGTFEKFVRKNWFIYYTARTLYEYFLSKLFLKVTAKYLVFKKKKKS